MTLQQDTAVSGSADGKTGLIAWSHRVSFLNLPLANCGNLDWSLPSSENKLSPAREQFCTDVL